MLRWRIGGLKHTQHVGLLLGVVGQTIGELEELAQSSSWRDPLWDLKVGPVECKGKSRVLAEA